MPPALPFHTLDVFTETPYLGNPLAVVLEADGLTTAQMQVIAREFNLSETIFVMAPRDPGHTARVRIFFPTAEIPFAGHPTLGCAALLARLRTPEGDFEDRILLEEEAGLVAVEIRCVGGSISGSFAAPVLPFDRDTAISTALLAAALGLPEDRIGLGAHVPRVLEGGPAFLYAPLSDLGSLARARPLEPHWSDLMKAAGVDSVYLYTPAPEGGFRARMFSPTAGIPEDPATGSAAAFLAVQLLAAGDLPEGESHWRIVQGVEMGRESRIGLTIRLADGALEEVRISGVAVAISDGRICPPAAVP